MGVRERRGGSGRAIRRRHAGRWAAVLAAGLLVAGCSGGGGKQDDDKGDGRFPYWQKGAGAAEAAAFMKVRVPQGATGVKGAVQVNPQENIYLLSFVTEEKTAVQVAADLRSKEPLASPHSVRPPNQEQFEHLGLPEPETLKGVRWVGVCPPCEGPGAGRSKVGWI